MEHGFIKVATTIPRVKVGDSKYNVEQMESFIAQAEGRGVEIIVFPEMSITGYTCQDLFRQSLLLESVETSVMMLMDFTRQLDIISIVGLPVATNGILVNCAAIIQKGQLIGLIPKSYLPNYDEFYEKRWFASADDIIPGEIHYAGTKVMLSRNTRIFQTCDGALFGVEICEDVWVPTPPSNYLTLAGADIIFNLSASDELIGKHDYLESLLAQQSARTISAYVYSGCGFGESTQDVVYGGNALIYENGVLLAKNERFSIEPQMCVAQIDVERLRAERHNNTTYINAKRNIRDVRDTPINIIECKPIETSDFILEREVEPHPFIPKSDNMTKSCEEIFNIQVMGLAKRLVHTSIQHVLVGISGGLDSTLALLVCVRTFDKLKLNRKGIIGVTMPGFGTSSRTHENAITLMQELGITMREVNIEDSVTQHFKDIGHNPENHDVTYENSQARERTQILMDMSNQLCGLVIGTGDLSELALGWTTYNGDHMSMYSVNVGIPKTLIAYLVRYVAGTLPDEKAKEVLLDIMDTPISPELIPTDNAGGITQKTEDLVGPYELHDFFIYYFLRYGFRPAKLYMLAQKAFDGHDTSAGTYSDDDIKHWLKVFIKRLFDQQFKRSCLPDGPKVGSISLSPRGDWRMPSDASYNLWLTECDTL